MAARDACDASNSRDVLYEDEQEDINQAINFSVLESKGEGSCFTDLEFPYIDEDEDEQLARVLEDSIACSRKSSLSRDKKQKQWKSFANGTSLLKKFKQFGLASWNTSPWKKNTNLHCLLICDVCQEQIHSGRSILCYWGQTVCLEHKTDGTPQCCSCHRFKLGNIRLVNLTDGRKLCLDCCSTAMMNTEDCRPLFREVYDFFKGLNMNIFYNIPILLVDQDEMTRIQFLTGGKEHPVLNPLGMTTYGLDVVISIAGSSRNGEDIQVVKEIQYLPIQHEVTSMLLLYGYPKLATGATLAHEMMHAWMRLQGYRGLDRNIEEGICEVMAHKWLDWHAFSGDEFLSSNSEQAQFLRNLTEFLKDGIERNYSEAYGDGFREAKWAVERYGLKYTMKCIAETGKFPQ